MADRMLIMMTSGPETPHRLGTPFFQASAATTLDVEVTIVFTMDGTLLLKKGVAEKAYVKEGSNKTVYQFMKEAKEYGVKMFVCPASLELHDLRMEDLIPECDGAMGASSYSAMGLEDDVAVFTY